MNVDRMIKCRALFLQSIAWLFNDSLYIDENFTMLLNGFLDNYLEEEIDKFRLIYCFKLNDDNKIEFYEEDIWQEELNRYLKYFTDPQKTIQIYNDLGDDIVGKISELVEMFYHYVCVVIDINKNKKIRQ